VIYLCGSRNILPWNNHREDVGGPFESQGNLVLALKGFAYTFKKVG